MTDGRGLLFDDVAEEYDRVRPGYPGELVDRAAARAGLRRGARVLEVGAGTGKLTRLLVERGYAVEAVEPGGRMAAVARRHVGDAVRFHVGRFEDAALADGAFAALFSATAWHWVDPAVGWSKAARVLAPGGVLALLSHFGASPSPLDHELLAAWRATQPEAADWSFRDEGELWTGAEARRGNVAELWAWLTKHELGNDEAAKLFTGVEIEAMRREVEETPEVFLGQVRTQSQYLRLDDESRAALERRMRDAIAAHGGYYRSRFFATLVTAVVVAQPK